MTDTLSKYRSIAEDLYNKTLSERIKWEEADYLDGVSADVGGYSVRIYHRSSDFEEPEVVVEVLNYGDVIDSFTDTVLSGGSSFPSNGAPGYYNMLVELIKLARRQVKGADKALDSILDGLKAF